MISPNKQSNGAFIWLALLYWYRQPDCKVQGRHMCCRHLWYLTKPCCRYEEVFAKALDMSDVDRVTWLCQQLDPIQLLNQEPLPLSQSVLLSLMQQLGSQLGKVRAPIILNACVTQVDSACAISQLLEGTLRTSCPYLCRRPACSAMKASTGCLHLGPADTCSGYEVPPARDTVRCSIRTEVWLPYVQDTAVKLLWIKEAAPNLDPNDPLLAPHMREILQALYQQLHACLLSSPPQQARTTKVVVHLVNSLLHQCQ